MGSGDDIHVSLYHYLYQYIVLYRPTGRDPPRPTRLETTAERTQRDCSAPRGRDFAALVKSVLKMEHAHARQLIETGVSVNMALREADVVGIGSLGDSLNSSSGWILPRDFSDSWEFTSFFHLESLDLAVQLCNFKSFLLSYVELFHCPKAVSDMRPQVSLLLSCWCCLKRAGDHTRAPCLSRNTRAPCTSQPFCMLPLDCIDVGVGFFRYPLVQKYRERTSI